MKNNFLCPYCKGVLNVKENIVLTVRTQKLERGLVFISPKLGNYETTTHPTFKLEEGEHLDILCPMCHANLQAIAVNENLARILMTDESQKVYEIIFSEIAGEHCTYKLVDHMIESYGEHKNNYVNYFGAKPNM
ncbi:MAG: hypothetical protein R3250_03995 [Melioribacteraceae bacterium]|nr:hypothetical protein [Melioribacteraceae bacterium]